MTFKDLRKIVDEHRKALGLYPVEDGNGHGHDDNDIRNAVIDAAERWSYQESKAQWIFHKSSYYYRGLSANDGEGCYATHCIPECEFYPAEGRHPVPPDFYENLIANPHSYQTFLEFIGVRIVYHAGTGKYYVSIIQDNPLSKWAYNLLK